jgi:hypothetical protein
MRTADIEVGKTYIEKSNYSQDIYRVVAISDRERRYLALREERLAKYRKSLAEDPKAARYIRVNKETGEPYLDYREKEGLRSTAQETIQVEVVGYVTGYGGIRTPHLHKEGDRMRELKWVRPQKLADEYDIEQALQAAHAAEQAQLARAEARQRQTEEARGAATELGRRLAQQGIDPSKATVAALKGVAPHVAIRDAVEVVEHLLSIIER